MLSFKVLAALLDYPNEDHLAHLAEMRALLAEEGRLPADAAARLDGFIDHLAKGDLLDLQAAWVDLFDRTRSLSLNLFEHVHGDSRDRGQAMVDLQAMYVERGLEISAQELPDYLPMLLEFISILPEAEAAALLGEAGHIVATLAGRLENRKSPYAAVMSAVAALAGIDVTDAVAGTASEPEEDIDAAWAEAPVEFGAGSALSGCGGRAAGMIRSERIA